MFKLNFIIFTFLVSVATLKMSVFIFESPAGIMEITLILLCFIHFYCLICRLFCWNWVYKIICKWPVFSHRLLPHYSRFHYLRCSGWMYLPRIKGLMYYLQTYQCGKKRVSKFERSLNWFFIKIVTFCRLF